MTGRDDDERGRYRRRRPDREAQRRWQGRIDRDKRDREAWQPGPPTDEDWVVGDRSGLRRVTGPERIGDAVDEFLGRTNWRDRVASTRLLDDWPGLVGQELAKHCEPVRLDRGVLVVAAESHAWATQLSWLQTTLRDKVNAAAGETLVQKVRVVVRGQES